MGTTLRNLQYFKAYENQQLTGSIPISISSASNLEDFQIGGNKFTGKIPSSENLHKLRFLSFPTNSLGTGGLGDLIFLCSLTNSTNLRFVAINDNKFGGILPECIGNLLNVLGRLSFDNNAIVGGVPRETGNLRNLSRLDAWNNKLPGPIPADIGKLRQLVILCMHRNKLSGKFHLSGELAQLMMSLIKLTLSDNNLHGNIPSSLCNCQNLTLLSLRDNNLSGIPEIMISLSSFSIGLGLARNHLSGSLSVEVGNLKKYWCVGCF